MKSVRTKVPVILCLIVALVSCKKHQVQPSMPTGPLKVLILGNSITYSPRNPGAGWNCDCGMAASAPDKDFVHLLTAHFKSVNASSTVAAKNIAEFERHFDTYDFADSLKTYRDAKPDIIIMKIGENVTRFADSTLFEEKYVELLDYFKANNPKVKILAAGSVWPDRELSNKIMSKYSGYVSLISLDNDYSNYAFGLFTDPEIQNHPSDKGMQGISDLIWAALPKLF